MSQSLQAAIENATAEIQKKEEKKSKKSTLLWKFRRAPAKNKVSEDHLKSKIEEVKHSPLMKQRSQCSAAEGRKTGICEKGELDREVVKLSLKKYNQEEYLNSYY